MWGKILSEQSFLSNSHNSGLWTRSSTSLSFSFLETKKYDAYHYNE